MQKENSYIIEGGFEGKKRLEVLAELLNASTHAFLASRGPLSDKRFLDVGSGGGSVSVMVSGMVGPQGHVTAIDFDQDIIDLCIADARHLKIGNITYRTLDAHALDYAEEFDVGYARFLLSHLQHPGKVLHRMIESLKQGGRIFIEDIDFSGHFCHPPSRAFDTYVSWFATAAANNGQDPHIGQKLFRLLRDESLLDDVRVCLFQPCYADGKGKQMAFLTLERIQETILQQGLADATTIKDVLAELGRLAEDKGAIISLPRIFQVSGVRK